MQPLPIGITMVAIVALFLLVVLGWVCAGLRGELRRVHETFNTQLARAREEQLAIATREAAVQLEAWKRSAEVALRQDAIERSQSVIVGRVTEQLTPFLPGFAWNPKDARFIGTPVDLIVFDGLDEGALREVVFVEVKTGGSALTPRERQVRDAIEAGRVRWRELRMTTSPMTSNGAGRSAGWWGSVWRRLTS